MNAVIGTSRLKNAFGALIVMGCISLVAGCASGTKVAPISSTSSTTPSNPSTQASAPVVTGTAQPLAMAYNPTTNVVYVANGEGNTVSVVDGTSFEVLDTITVEADPTGIAVNPVTNKIYVVNSGAESLSVIDGTTNTITATIPGGYGQVAVNPVTDRIYVLDSRGAENYNVSVLDGATNKQIGTVQVGGNADNIAINTVTNTFYVTNGKALIVVDGATNGIVATILPPPATSKPVDTAGPTDGVAVDATTNTIYFSNDGGTNTVDVVNGDTNSLTTAIPIPTGQPGAIVVNPLTHMIYVANSDKAISVIDGSSNAIASTISIKDIPTNVLINPAPNLLYVSSAQSIGVINLVT
jgi:YVTN family beta-propeller protein